MIALHTLAEGPGWVVVAKPARLACHRSELVQDRMTLHRMAEHQFGPPIHLVHRLDRAASGCLVLGRNPATAQRLQTAMTAPGAHKVYLAMVRGFFCWDDPVAIDKPMADDNGVERDARSVVEVIGRSHAPRCSLLRVRPETGRFHQVRRHVRDLNHPILGDRIHGDSRENVRWRDEQGLSRLALHALSIDLPMDDGTRLQVTCPPPADLAAVWQRMPWWADAQAAEPALLLPPVVLRSPNPV